MAESILPTCGALYVYREEIKKCCYGTSIIILVIVAVLSD